ncbi:hypothetical protein [Nonomuraea rhodomycinica]|uniref:Uncharacterized protein n=1 Tax=Nonomuraea rhodomycinica TaxID=1712872 RepID=A0A7Y6MH28_9ACTN|nr:hypothetical protein [Nonomuraea rhodomycinica]NUW46291.1 hypothetical protein [Nonomuraea rhodomycinica]
MTSSLSLARRVRPYEKLTGSSFRSECRFLDFVIDGRSLLEMMSERNFGNADMASVLWLAPTLDDDDAVGRLLGRSASPLDDGRIPLYVCPECGDLGCGALTVVLEISSGQVIWRDPGWQTDYEDEVHYEDFADISPFVFDRAQYEAVLSTVSEFHAREEKDAPAKEPAPWWMWWRR